MQDPARYRYLTQEEGTARIKGGGGHVYRSGRVGEFGVMPPVGKIAVGDEGQVRVEMLYGENIERAINRLSLAVALVGIVPL